MVSIKLIMISLASFLSCTAADENALIQACEVNDIKCIRKSTSQFLKATAGGIPLFHLQAIDPVKIDSVEQDLGSKYNIRHIYKNVTVTGLKDQVVDEFKPDRDAKTNFLRMKTHIKATGKLTIEYSKPKNQKFHGTFTSEGDVMITVTHPYDIQKGKDNHEHYILGKETIKCEVLNSPKFTVDKKLTEELDKHQELKEVRAKFRKDTEKLIKWSICDVVNKIYPAFVQNIRVTAKALPRSAFFKNV